VGRPPTPTDEGRLLTSESREGYWRWWKSTGVGGGGGMKESLGWRRAVGLMVSELIEI